MRVDDLQPAPGSTKAAQRVGRGIGGRRGKMPMKQRVPKLKGFNNPFRIEYQAVNLDTLEECGLDDVTPASLHEHGLVHKGALVKVLGRGDLHRAVRVSAHAFSAAATQAVRAAGGSVEVLPLPYRSGRPPVKGNQFANR